MSFIFDRKYKAVTPQLQGWPLHTFQKQTEEVFPQESKQNSRSVFSDLFLF